MGGVLPQLFPHLPIVPQIIGGLQGQRHLRWELQLTSVNKSKTPQREQPEKRGLFRASDLHDYLNIIHKH